MKKFTKCAAVLCLIFSLTSNHRMYSQELDEVKIFKEMPDSLLKFSEDWLQPFYSTDMRNILLQDKFHQNGVSSYSVDNHDLFDSDAPIKEDDPDKTNYVVEINNQLNWISLQTNSSYYWTTLDYFLIQEYQSYSIVLLERYSQYFMPPIVQSISKYYYDYSKNAYIEKDIEIPELKWSDFYSLEDVNKLNMYYLEDVKITESISIVNLDDEIVFSILPDLEEAARGFIGMLDHVFENEPNQWEENAMTQDSLGFNEMANPKAVFYSFPDFKLYDSDEFELAYLYNSFSDKFANELDIEFALRDNRKAEETLFWNEQYSIGFIDSTIIITSEMMNKSETKAFCIKNDSKEYFVVCRNASGFVSESQFRIFERDKLSLKKEITSEVINTVKNEDFGIDYSENVFEKFPDVFSLKYETDKSSLKISLLVNPPFGNKEAEKIISKMSGESKVLEYTWSDVIK